MKQIKHHEFTDQQKEAYRSIKWLYGGARRTGRTYLLAVVFVEQALEYQGEWVYVADHSLPHRSYNTIRLMDMVNDLALSHMEDGRKGLFSYKYSEFAIRFDGYEDAIPTGFKTKG